MGYDVTFTHKDLECVENNKQRITYTYNANGIRTNKVIYNKTKNTTTNVEFVLDGNKIIKEVRTSAQNYTIKYYYDSNSEVIGFNYNNNDYFYLKDVQGNVSKIIDTSGNIMVEYYYSCYGYNIKTIDNSNISLSTINPYRYRSYYQDNETGWYYLNSRYYDSDTCRFISMDDISYLGASNTINSYNLFTYCENNPVMYVDYEGNLSKCIFKVSSLFSVGIVRVIFYKKKKYEILEWNDNDYKYNQND